MSPRYTRYTFQSDRTAFVSWILNYRVSVSEKVPKAGHSGHEGEIRFPRNNCTAAF